MVDFAVTKNDQAHIQAIEKEYSHQTKFLKWMSYPISFIGTKITLVIPKEVCSDGWSIKPDNPQLEVSKIDNYRSGGEIPKIRLHMRWIGKGIPKEQTVQIEVEGAEHEFYLICQLPPPEPIPLLMPSVSDKPTLSLLQRFPTNSTNIIHKISVKSHDLGKLLLNDDTGKIIGEIEGKYERDSNQATEAILQRWLHSKN